MAAEIFICMFPIEVGFPFFGMNVCPLSLMPSVMYCYHCNINFYTLHCVFYTQKTTLIMCILHTISYANCSSQQQRLDTFYSMYVGYHLWGGNLGELAACSL